MRRTIVSLQEDDKRWLDEQAEREGVAMTEIVRRAVGHYRQHLSLQADPSLDKLLEETRGLWRHGDAVEYQRRLRKEWEDR